MEWPQYRKISLEASKNPDIVILTFSGTKEENESLMPHSFFLEDVESPIRDYDERILQKIKLASGVDTFTGKTIEEINTVLSFVENFPIDETD